MLAMQGGAAAAAVAVDERFTSKAAVSLAVHALCAASRRNCWASHSDKRRVVFKCASVRTKLRHSTPSAQPSGEPCPFYVRAKLLRALPPQRDPAVEYGGDWLVTAAVTAHTCQQLDQPPRRRCRGHALTAVHVASLPAVARLAPEAASGTICWKAVQAAVGSSTGTTITASMAKRAVKVLRASAMRLKRGDAPTLHHLVPWSRALASLDVLTVLCVDTSVDASVDTIPAGGNHAGDAAGCRASPLAAAPAPTATRCYRRSFLCLGFCRRAMVHARHACGVSALRVAGPVAASLMCVVTADANNQPVVLCVAHVLGVLPGDLGVAEWRWFLGKAVDALPLLALREYSVLVDGSSPVMCVAVSAATGRVLALMATSLGVRFSLLLG